MNPNAQQPIEAQKDRPAAIPNSHDFLRADSSQQALAMSQVSSDQASSSTTQRRSSEDRVSDRPAGLENGDTVGHTTARSWDNKYLLSLDGGGVRGYSTLLILKELMRICGNIESTEDPAATSSYHPISFKLSHGSSITNMTNDRPRSSRYLPVHYFDYIAGTSTGGLIAIMLGRLRMNVDDCITEYKTLGENIFGKPRLFSMRGPLPANRAKYDHDELEKAVQSVIRRRLNQEDQVGDGTFRSSPDRCRTIITAVRENSNSTAPYLFRTYEHPRTKAATKVVLNPGPPNSNVPIWQVARATTAAPTYFEPIVIGKDKFLDGGFCTQANNPAWYAFTEVSQMHGRNDSIVALTLSIGTGVPKKMQPFPKTNTLFGKYKAIIGYTVHSATDSEIVHEQMTRYTQQNGCPYERFNVEDSLGNVKLGEWKIKTLRNPKRRANVTLLTIEEKTAAYLKRADVVHRLWKVARILVANRQARARNRAKWEIVATGQRYRCTIRNCRTSNVFHTSEEGLRQHLVSEHGDSGFRDPPETEPERRLLAKWIQSGTILHAE